MKAYTDLKQAKKLTKILQDNTADMCYIRKRNPDLYNEPYCSVRERLSNKKSEFLKATPCWTLAALIDIIPYSVKYKGVDLFFKTDKYWDDYCVSLSGGTGLNCTSISFLGKELIDACVDLILKLDKLNLLNTTKQ